MRARGAIWIGIVLLAVLPSAATERRVAVVSPASGEALVGEVVFRFAVAPGEPAIDRIDVVAGDEVIGTARAPDWSFRWEAPIGFAHWRLRAIASGRGRTVEEFVFLTRRMAPAQRVDVGLVQLAPTVLDPAGGYVGDLRRRDFRVLDNGVPVQLRSFSTVQGPVRLALVVDVSRSMAGRIDLLRDAVREFRRQLRADDAWALYAFNHRLYEFGVQDAPPSLETLEPYGGTAVFDALAKILPRLGVRGERRAIFLVSDGKDDTSQLDEERIVRRARRQQIPIYTVGVAGGGAEYDRGRLRSLAEATGGRAFFIRTPRGLGDALIAVERDLRTRYRLSYEMPPGPPGRRTVEVRVSRPDHRVLHRDAYTAE